MPSTDDRELRAFVQKIQEKGSDAFAAGPWKDRDDDRSGERGTAAGATGKLPAAEAQRREATRGNTQAARTTPGHARATAPGFADRALTGLAMIALGIFIVGSLGLYLSYRPELKAIATPDTTVQPDSTEPQQAQFGDIEQQLSKITGRLEELSSEIAALSSNSDIFQEMNQTLLANPPAALPPGLETATPMETMSAHPEQDARITLLEQDEVSETLQDPQSTGFPQLETAYKGRWVINLASCAKEKTAKKMQADFQQKGIDTEVITTSVDGKTMYRIRVPGFGSRKSAQSRATSLSRELGLDGAWVMKGG